MNQRESVCIKDGCLWLNGGVCSRECEYKKGAVREYDAICRSAYRQRGAEEDGFCLGDMV